MSERLDIDAELGHLSRHARAVVLFELVKRGNHQAIAKMKAADATLHEAIGALHAAQDEVDRWFYLLIDAARAIERGRERDDSERSEESRLRSLDATG